jgi:myosin heavy subunit
MDTLTNRIAELEEQLENQLDAEQLEKDIEAARSELESLQQQLHARESEYAQACEEREVLQTLTEEQSQELRTAKAEVEKLQSTLVERDKELEEQLERIIHNDDHTGEREVDFSSTEEFHPDVSEFADLAVESGSQRTAPKLICFTSDKPRQYDLRKRVTTIGRGSHCEIQLLTHFVSREHARLYNREGIVTIEDLGSKNGIFVNSVRVESQMLQHGDWVTVGETQFRYINSDA